MEGNNTKEMIKVKAIELFSEKGFYGTSIREIAEAAGCSLPMLYYYFHNKNDLFEEVAFTEFTTLTKRLNEAIPEDLTLEEIYFNSIRQRKHLSTYDKAVYKLAIKILLGFEGTLDVREKLLVWERERYLSNRVLLSRICEDDGILDIITSVMVGIFDKLIQRIILLDEEISDQSIKEHINFLLKYVKFKF